MLAHEEEPVAPPRHIADNSAIAGHIKLEAGKMAVGRNVTNRCAGVRMKAHINGADRCLNQVIAAANALKVSKCCCNPNHSMAAHPEVARVIEEDDCGGAGGIGRFEQ